MKAREKPINANDWAQSKLKQLEKNCFNMTFFSPIFPCSSVLHNSKITNHLIQNLYNINTQLKKKIYIYILFSDCRLWFIFLKNSAWDYDLHSRFKIAELQECKTEGKQIMTRHAGVCAWVWVYALGEEEDKQQKDLC